MSMQPRASDTDVLTAWRDVLASGEPRPTALCGQRLGYTPAGMGFRLWGLRRELGRGAVPYAPNTGGHGPMAMLPHEQQRAQGLLLCRCAGPRQRDLMCPRMCAQCFRRIDRQHDHEVLL